MPLGEVISIRLELATETQMRHAADMAGLGIGVYLRRRIESMVPLDEELSALRSTIDLLALHDPSTIEALTPISIETLLLLRAVASPAQLRAVHAEMDRQGMQLWQAATPPSRQGY